jgi:hypothetical protein
MSSSPESAAALFPFAVENRWHYDVEVSRSGGRPQTLTAVKYFRDSLEIGQRHYARFATEVSGGTLRVPSQLVRLGDEGLYTAVQGAEGKELLVLPADPREVRSWSGEAPPAITCFAGQATVDEAFEHGSLEFDRCVKVTLSMIVREMSLLGRQSVVPVRIERWFAPGIGMVREMRLAGDEGKPQHMSTECRLRRLTKEATPQ